MNISVEDTEYDNLLIYLPKVCAFIQDALDHGGRVLVHCVMGISRSSAAVAAFRAFPKLFHVEGPLTSVSSDED